MADPIVPARLPRRVSLCPDCGWPLATGFRPGLDEGDVEPTAICTKPSCEYHY